MRKYLLPSLLVLLLGAGLSVAQTINKALQLSQDATGAFGVDSNNGVYFPGHILSPTGGQRPSPTIGGTGTPTIVGTDTAGLITMGASATTATATFGTAYVTVPWCLVLTQNTLTTTNISVTLATTSIAIVQPSASGNKINYMCMSAS